MLYSTMKRNGEDIALETLILDWQPVTGGARLVRAYGTSPIAVIPTEIEGLPLVEVGAYCFSATEPKPRGEVRRTALGTGDTTALCGNYLQALTLPDTVELLDNAAFYNCRRLERLTLGAHIRQVGSDLFSNCFALQWLEIHAQPDAPTGLRQLLGAVGGDVQVQLEGAQLYYPEYEEEIDENAPAHVFNHTIWGQGYRYRQCFNGNTVSYGEYDKTFLQEKAAETPQNMCRLALGRLRYPHRLADWAEAAYRDYLSGHGSTAMELLAAGQDVEGINFLLGLGLADAAALEAGQRLALNKGYGEISALLLDWQHRLFAPKKKTYDFNF